MATLGVGPFSLTVSPASNGLSASPSTGTLTGATEGEAYDQDVCVVSGGTAPYTLSNFNDIPSGLALEFLEDGVTVALQGTPAIGTAAESPFEDITFDVTDSSGAVAQVKATPNKATPSAPPRPAPVATRGGGKVTNQHVPIRPAPEPQKRPLPAPLTHH